MLHNGKHNSTQQRAATKLTGIT